MTLPHPSAPEVRRSRRRGGVGGGVCVGLALTLGSAALLYGAGAPARPGPTGFLVGGPAAVVAFDGRWRGAPPEAPLAWVDGAFQLESLPYGPPGRFASVFFVREGSAAAHRSVSAPGPDDGEAPGLGLVALKPLPEGQGALTGAVVVLDPSGRWVEGYRDVALRLRAEDGRCHEVASGGAEGFSTVLPPGRYTVRAEDREVVPSRVDIVAGQGAVAVFALVGEPAPSAP
ncbi:MAG: hypothetical protein D6731_14800 [Planctomycetota bacterium]|nr:MAG: hypothetical protein D6731_14800 [Planctomycetota bacterium]